MGESYYDLHKEECKKRCLEYYHNVAKHKPDHKKKVSEYNKEYFQKNREKIYERQRRNSIKREKKELTKEERDEKKRKRQAYMKQYRKNNIEKVKMWDQRVYAKKREITREKREQRQKEWEESCFSDSIKIYFD